MQQDKFYLAEDIFSAIIQGIGILLSAASMSMIVVISILKRQPDYVLFFAIYGAAMTLYYITSVISHASQRVASKSIFEVINNASSYLYLGAMISVLACAIHQSLTGRILLIITAFMTLISIIFSIISGPKFHRYMLVFSGLMAVLFVVSYYVIKDKFYYFSQLYMLSGLISFFVGVLFRSIHTIPFNHTIWHVLQLSGNIFIFFSFFMFVAF